MPVDERVPEREVLRHTRERVVDRLTGVGVVLPHHLADGLRRLLVLAIGTQPLRVHAVEDPALHRLESVARHREARVR